jgi:hypothetical protein
MFASCYYLSTLVVRLGLPAMASVASGDAVCAHQCAEREHTRGRPLRAAQHVREALGSA